MKRQTGLFHPKGEPGRSSETKVCTYIKLFMLAVDKRNHVFLITIVYAFFCIALVVLVVVFVVVVVVATARFPFAPSHSHPPGRLVALPIAATTFFRLEGTGKTF